jgi:hypothetical protein
MKRAVVGAVACLALILHAAALAQTRPDFTGRWQLNQDKSGGRAGGNGQIVPFSTQIDVTQTATELHVTASSVRQEPISAVFNLDGSKVTLKAPRGITETGEAKFDGAKLVITSRRSFTSPLGETVVEF